MQLTGPGTQLLDPVRHFCIRELIGLGRQHIASSPSTHPETCWLSGGLSGSVGCHFRVRGTGHAPRGHAGGLTCADPRCQPPTSGLHNPGFCQVIPAGESNPTLSRSLS